MRAGPRASRIAVLGAMVALAGGAAALRVQAAAGTASVAGAASVVADPVFPDGRFALVGRFEEELGGFPGTILQVEGCSAPVGILSVRASYSAMAASELRWREGAFRPQYVYRGVEHDPGRASMTLPAANVAYRAMAAVGAIGRDGLTQYLKVFVPAECPALPPVDLRQIEAALSG